MFPRRKTMSDPEEFQSRSSAKRGLGERLRQVRIELYGEHGAPELARLLGLPHRTWFNHENGVTIPGEVLLDLLVLTRVEPQWLLRGVGARFRPTLGGSSSAGLLKY
jgi:hypothetical protein